ncbi:hypothetical protein CgIS1_12000 [Frankia sp. CgS1]|nr:hypothetical protein CgIS1_12000 [Frankia sp. CgIS1]
MERQCGFSGTRLTVNQNQTLSRGKHLRKPLLKIRSRNIFRIFGKYEMPIGDFHPLQDGRQPVTEIFNCALNGFL